MNDTTNDTTSPLAPTDRFVHRHIGPRPGDLDAMLAEIGCTSLEQLVAETIPAAIRLDRELELGPERTEAGFLAEFRQLAAKNRVFRSYIGAGYHGTIVPSVLQRNILENPGWYTQYTPYQAEISQGRLEALLNYQTMVADLTGLALANASLLDEATAAAEALAMCHRIGRGKRDAFFVADDLHPQTIAVIRTRNDALGFVTDVGDPATFADPDGRYAAALFSYPSTTGLVRDLRGVIETAHAAGTLVVVAADLLSLTLLMPPGDLGADVCVGSTQRFGVPMGYGGPHAAFFATKEEHKRMVPGRIIGLSRDANGAPALRMAMQTREQHIRREKATSNICTAQVLLAILAGMYAVYHGPDGLRAIAQRVHFATGVLARALVGLGYDLAHATWFDTLHVRADAATRDALHAASEKAGINFRELADGVGVALDETVTEVDLQEVVDLFARVAGREAPQVGELEPIEGQPAALRRTSAFLEHRVFHDYRAEHEMLRYLKRLEARDLSLTTSMIPLGSCTMKLNATAEMLPLSWPEFAALHPFAPREQATGYTELFTKLESALCEITGFAAVSLQPNAGSQGEYSGLLVVRAWHESRGESHRDACLIPVSAHGTNPASAVLAGMRVVPVACDEKGNIDLADLAKKAEANAEKLAALMVTYPSTHGVFEEAIRDICAIVHEHGGQVYLDGANMNAQVGLCRPGDYGADVCHLNLHKTFCIPHGGGGPGMGPIGVAAHLAPFLPGHPLVATGGEQAIGPVSAAPWGSPSILTISWAYIAMMGAAGLRRASEVAILNANYMARRLAAHYPLLYSGPKGRVAHEFILDLRPFERSADVTGEDVAKRLMDYGFHAPTMSFPVAGTLMIEPTESESRAELDRLCDAFVQIRAEIRAIEEGRFPREDNPLCGAPHTVTEVCGDTWKHAYSRETAAFPLPSTRENKVWPKSARIDNGYGDKNLICTCPPMEAWVEDETIPTPLRTTAHAAPST